MQIRRRGTPQTGPLNQGTRVGTPQIGTIDGPKQQPTETQFGGNVSVPTTQSTVTQVRGWPSNPIRNILPFNGSREWNEKTDWELQNGEAPGKVLRQMYERMRGTISGEGQASFPYDAAWSLLVHQVIPREAQQTGMKPRMTDDSVSIGAVYAGNVRLG